MAEAINLRKKDPKSESEASKRIKEAVARLSGVAHLKSKTFEELTTQDKNALLKYLAVRAGLIKG